MVISSYPSYQYQIGACLAPDAPSYIVRQADSDFYEALKAGQFCYVFNSRQMGKSSLRVHTMQTLLREGIACGYIDMNLIVTHDLTPDSFYATIIQSLADEFDISFKVSSWWRERELLSPLQRMSEFIEEILLKEIVENIVIFIDEIDSLLNLKFPTDDFFAFIRSCHEKRVDKPAYQRLTFALLGVATPSVLIQDRRRTPFNLGYAIELNGFQESEALPLAEGLVECSSNPQAVLKEILSWTGGQPFLTQKLCQLVVKTGEVISPGSEAKLVQELVQKQVIENWQDSDHPQHLRTIEDRISQSNQKARLLGLYQQILEGGEVTADDSPEEMELRLSGLVVKQQGKLKVYNRIYKAVFDKNWLVKELGTLRPYGEAMTKWLASGSKEKSWLLRGKALEESLIWARNNARFNTQDWEYLNACTKAQSNAFIKKVLWFSIINAVACLGLGWGVRAIWNYQQYASCPIGRKINGVCFRKVITSGEKERLFLSQNNFYLVKGSEFFNQEKYNLAIISFQQAIDADPTDPVSHIYLNNAIARQRGNALKLAVAVPVDYFENTAKEMLRGVADAQTEFNKNRGKNGRLLEIVIANDGNEPEVSKEVAKELAAEPDILGIIGHDSSESSKAALTIYENKRLAMISATSTSSKLKSDVLFRTVAPTTESAKTYARYVRNNLGLDKVIIFYYLDSIYSTSLKEDFSKEFSKLRGEVRTVSLIAPPQNIEKEINQAIQQNVKLGFLIPSVKTDSIAMAISRKNQKLKFFQEKDLTRNPKGMILSGPCLAEQSKSRYMKEATKKWETDISATTAASYDATQALIEAINRSSNNPTKEEILNNLKSVTLPVGKTSGFGLEWSKENSLDHFNVKRNYCIY